MSTHQLNFKSTNQTWTLKAEDAAYTGYPNSGQFSIYNGTTKLWGITESGFSNTPENPYILGTPGRGTPAGTSGDATNFYTLFANNLTFSNNVIVVPFSGNYMISFNTINLSTSNVRYDTHIKINGSIVSSGLNETNTTGYKFRGHTLIYRLVSGDNISVTNGNWYTSGLVYDNWGTLSVHLMG